MNAEENLAELRLMWWSASLEDRPAIEAAAENVKKAVERAKAWALADEVAKAERESAQAERAHRVGDTWTPERIRSVMAGVQS